MYYVIPFQPSGLNRTSLCSEAASKWIELRNVRQGLQVRYSFEGQVMIFTGCQFIIDLASKPGCHLLIRFLLCVQPLSMAVVMEILIIVGDWWCWWRRWGLGLGWAWHWAGLNCSGQGCNSSGESPRFGSIPIRLSLFNWAFIIHKLSNFFVRIGPSSLHGQKSHGLSSCPIGPQKNTCELAGQLAGYKTFLSQYIAEHRGVFNGIQLTRRGRSSYHRYWLLAVCGCTANIFNLLT